MLRSLGEFCPENESLKDDFYDATNTSIYNATTAAYWALPQVALRTIGYICKSVTKRPRHPHQTTQPCLGTSHFVVRSITPADQLPRLHSDDLASGSQSEAAPDHVREEVERASDHRLLSASALLVFFKSSTLSKGY